MNKTKIEYMTHSWNPIAMRCTPVSEGCKHCWHLDINKRFKFHSGPPELREKELGAPRKLKEPAIIGTQFMGDLLHKDIPTRHIQSVLGVIKKCPQHIFLILTKRIEEFWNQRAYFLQGPLPENMWLGVTVENDKHLDRIETLLQIPAAVRFVSIEPMLGPVDIMYHFAEPTGNFRTHQGKRQMELKPHNKLNWVICGGESGPKARPMHPEWVRSVRDQCVEAGVPFFFKQWGEFIGVDYILDNGFLEAAGIWECSDGRQHDEIKKRPQGDDRWIKVGKKAAGRLLDGREHNEYPAPGH